jgi:hypothetical protein
LLNSLPSEAEDLGGGEVILAVLVASPDGLAHGHGRRTRHGDTSEKRKNRFSPGVIPAGPFELKTRFHRYAFRIRLCPIR